MNSEFNQNKGQTNINPVQSIQGHTWMTSDLSVFQHAQCRLVKLNF